MLEAVNLTKKYNGVTALDDRPVGSAHRGDHRRVETRGERPAAGGASPGSANRDSLSRRVVTNSVTLLSDV
jgi:hypothetical protein